MRLSRKLRPFSLWLSLTFHALLLLSFTVMLWHHPQWQESPAVSIPSYLYQGAATMPSPQVQPQPNQPRVPAPKEMATSKHGLEKSAAEKKVTEKNAREKTMTEQSISQKKSTMVNLNQFAATAKEKNEEPVHLIGDKKINQPLITLLGKALSKHLIYPRSAIDFRVTGTVYIRFLLHPEGYLTNVEIVRSSNVGVLDEAGLAAINAMSPVQGVDQYIKEPKSLVVGIIFG